MRKSEQLAFGMLLLLGTACQRSAQYRRDEDYPRADQSPSYYSGGGAGTGVTTQKVESLGQPKKRVIVLDFWNDTPAEQQSDVGQFAADELRRGLFTTHRVIIPTDIKPDRTTEDFVQGEKVKVAQLVREGRRMGIAVLVIGRLTKLTYRQRGDEVGLLRQRQALAAADLEIKIFDVGAGREILAASKTGEATSNTMGGEDEETSAVSDSGQDTQKSPRAELMKMAVREATNRLVPDVLKAIEKMAWEGRVAKVNGNRVYVNAGRASGLVGGDILKVLTPGDDVYDPSSGAFLGRSQGQLKGTLEVLDFLGTDGAVTEVHTGGNFQEGDVVQLY